VEVCNSNGGGGGYPEPLVDLCAKDVVPEKPPLVEPAACPVPTDDVVDSSSDDISYIDDEAADC
jgi:hypothetical protein